MGKIRFSGRAAICLILMIISVAAVFIARKWPYQTALFPVVTGITLFALSVPTLILILTGKGEGTGKQAAVDRQLSDDRDDETAGRGTMVAFSWVFGFFLLILSFGFPIAIGLFVLLYTKFQGGEKWWISLTMTFFSWLCFWGLFVRLLHIPFQQGLLQQGLKMVGIG